MRQEKAPGLVLKAMKPGGLSLDWKTMPLGSQGAPIGLHLYCVPPSGVKPSELGPGSTIASSPFYAEFWSAEQWSMDFFMEQKTEMFFVI